VPRQSIGFYICSGLDLTEPLKRPLRIYGILEIGSILLNIVVYFHIKLYKRSDATTPVQAPVLPSHTRKLFFLKDIKPETLSSKLTNFLNILIIVIGTFNQALVNKISSKDINMFPYTLFVYYIFLIAPMLVASLSLIVYYCNHPPLRKAIFGEAKSALQRLGLGPL
jgi:hypothetical protein